MPGLSAGGDERAGGLGPPVLLRCGALLRAAAGSVPDVGRGPGRAGTVTAEPSPGARGVRRRADRVPGRPHASQVAGSASLVEEDERAWVRRAEEAAVKRLRDEARLGV